MLVAVELVIWEMVVPHLIQELLLQEETQAHVQEAVEVHNLRVEQAALEGLDTELQQVDHYLRAALVQTTVRLVAVVIMVVEEERQHLLLMLVLVEVLRGLGTVVSVY
jgi:hypothetical protein